MTDYMGGSHELFQSRTANQEGEDRWEDDRWYPPEKSDSHLPEGVMRSFRPGQEWPGVPCLCRCFKAVLDAMALPPHVLDFAVRGGLLGAGFPKPTHDCGIDI